MAPLRNHIIISDHGYYKINVGKEHLLADAYGYAYIHHLVWFSRRSQFTILNCLHHINGDKLDNRIENLEIMTRNEHSKKHAETATRGDDGRFMKGEK